MWSFCCTSGRSLRKWASISACFFRHRGVISGLIEKKNEKTSRSQKLKIRRIRKKVQKVQKRSDLEKMPNFSRIFFERNTKVLENSPIQFEKQGPSTSTKLTGTLALPPTHTHYHHHFPSHHLPSSATPLTLGWHLGVLVSLISPIVRHFQSV